MLQTYEIGNKMHMLHSVALLASPMAQKPILVSVSLELSLSFCPVFSLLDILVVVVGFYTK